MKKALSTAALAFCLFLQPARAATIVVANTNNTGTGSLRAAVTAARDKADRLLQQLSNDRLGGRVRGQRVKVALDDDGSRFFVHGRGHRRTGRP